MFCPSAILSPTGRIGRTLNGIKLRRDGNFCQIKSCTTKIHHNAKYNLDLVFIASVNAFTTISVYRGETPMTKAKNFTRRQVIGTMAVAAVGATATFEASAADSAPNESQQVQSAQIVRYSFGWNTARKVGILYLYLQNGSQPATINVASPEEFVGYLAILKEPQVFFDSNGWIYTGTQNPR